MAVPGVKLNKDDILHALKQKKGIISYAADSLGCDRATIYDWKDRDEDVANAIKKCREDYAKELKEKDDILVDKAYEALQDLLETRDTTAVIFTLKAKAGWVQDAVNHNVTIVKNDKPYKEKNVSPD